MVILNGILLSLKENFKYRFTFTKYMKSISEKTGLPIADKWTTTILVIFVFFIFIDKITSVSMIKTIQHIGMLTIMSIVSIFFARKCSIWAMTRKMKPNLIYVISFFVSFIILLTIAISLGFA